MGGELRRPWYRKQGVSFGGSPRYANIDPILPAEVMNGLLGWWRLLLEADSSISALSPESCCIVVGIDIVARRR